MQGPGTPHEGSLNLTEDAMERTPKCEEAAGILSFQEDSQSYPISGLLPVPRLGHRSVTGVCPSLPSVTPQEAGPLRARSPCGCGLRSSYIPPWERKLLSSSRRKLPTPPPPTHSSQTSSQQPQQSNLTTARSQAPLCSQALLAPLRIPPTRSLLPRSLSAPSATQQRHYRQPLQTDSQERLSLPPQHPQHCLGSSL